MPRYRLVLVCLLAVVLTACTSSQHSSHSSTALMAGATAGSSSSARATASVRPTRSQTASARRVGFQTSLGWCGPERPLPRTTVLIYFYPDGVHPTCVSVGPMQRLGVVNMTDFHGLAGSTVSVDLPGAPQRRLSPGSELIFPGTGDQVLREGRTTLTLTSHLFGLGDGGATIWRVTNDGTVH